MIHYIVLVPTYEYQKFSDSDLWIFIRWYFTWEDYSGEQLDKLKMFLSTLEIGRVTKIPIPNRVGYKIIKVIV